MSEVQQGRDNKVGQRRMQDEQSSRKGPSDLSIGIVVGRRLSASGQQPPRHVTLACPRCRGAMMPPPFGYPVSMRILLAVVGPDTGMGEGI